MKIFESRD